MTLVRPTPVRLAPGDRVLACRALAPELRALGVPEQQLTLLDQGLHRYPQDLRKELGEHLAALEDDPAASRVILVYGYCGGGMEGLSPRRVELVLPAIHDCVPLILGGGCPASRARCGQAYYLSPGWIDHGKTPYSEYFQTLERFGQEDALWTAREMLKGYDQVVLVATLAGIRPHHLRYAMEMSDLFGLGLRQEMGGDTLLRDLLSARHQPGILHVQPGGAVTLASLPPAPGEA